MENNGGLGMRNWGGYYEQSQMKGGLSLQLMSAGERDPKPMMLPDPPVPMDYMRDNWMYHHQHQLQHQHQHQHQHHKLQIPPINSNYDVHTLQILEQPDLSSTAKSTAPTNSGRKNNPSKKRTLEKSPKTKKPRNSITQKGKNKASSQVKEPKKNMAMVINGMNLDISQLPTPVCSCTGNPQQCYRWGVGGWQSACCTTNLSVYPLPMNSKRQGARIAGRKMSLGAFRKVLEKLVMEGFDLSSVIDLKTHWAKHGTNKFVTIK